MKSIIAIFLLAFSMLAHAGESLTAEFYENMATYRSALLAASGPFQRSLVVDELVDKMELHDVDVKVSVHPIDSGAVYFPGVIIIGSNLASLPREQLAFVLAHEYGHHTRMHWHSTLSRGIGVAALQGKTVKTVEELAVFINVAVTPETSHHDEYEADQMAAQLLKQYGLFNAKAIKSLFDFLGPEDATSSHPSTERRLNAILQQ